MFLHLVAGEVVQSYLLNAYGLLGKSEHKASFSGDEMSFAGYCLVRFFLSDFSTFFFRPPSSRFGLVWFRLSCDHGWVRSGSVNVK